MNVAWRVRTGALRARGCVFSACVRVVFKERIKNIVVPKRKEKREHTSLRCCFLLLCACVHTVARAAFAQARRGCDRMKRMCSEWCTRLEYYPNLLV